MDLSTTILGKSTVDELRARVATPILRIGTDQFLRADLARVACFNFQAAQNLSTVLNNGLQVKNTKDVFERVPPEALVQPRLGAVSLAVLGAAFEARGLGGDSPLETWARKHSKTLHTFDTLKTQARVAQQRMTQKKGRRG